VWTIEARGRDYAVSDETGGHVGEVALAAWPAIASVECAEGWFHIYRDSSGTFILKKGGLALGRAVKRRVVRSTFTVESGGERFVLVHGGPWSRRMVLYHFQSSIGSIDGSLSRYSRMGAADAHLPDGLPAALRLFLVWLAMLQWTGRA